MNIVIIKKNSKIYDLLGVKYFSIPRKNNDQKFENIDS